MQYIQRHFDSRAKYFFHNIVMVEDCKMSELAWKYFLFGKIQVKYVPIIVYFSHIWRWHINCCFDQQNCFKFFQIRESITWNFFKLEKVLLTQNRHQNNRKSVLWNEIYFLKMKKIFENWYVINIWLELPTFVIVSKSVSYLSCNRFWLIFDPGFNA